ncbi:MAG: GDSL-type esterase/lipase family protein [Erythrobacter sp.]
MDISFKIGGYALSPRTPEGPPPLAPPTAPAYLAASVSPYAAYGTQRMVAGYSGPLFTLRRNDGATLDVVPQAGGDYPDYAAIDAWAGGNVSTVATLHDQSGNGRHLTQATVANQPGFDTSQRFGNGVPILFDGFNRTATAANPQVNKKLAINGVSGIDSHALSAFLAVQPQTSYNRLGYLAVTDAASADRFRLFQGITANAITARLSGNSQSRTAPGPQVRFSPNVIGVSVEAGTLDIWANGTSAAVSGLPATAAAATRIVLGDCESGNADFWGMFRFFGGALYTGRVSGANGTAIVNSLNAALAHSNGFASAPEYNVLLIGDSIMEGTGSRLLKNMPHLLSRGLSRPHRIFNSAVHGETMATAYSQRTTRYGSTIVAGVPNVAVLQIGTNDIGNGTAAATLYTNTTTPFISYLKSLGYLVIATTLTPRQRADWTTAQETRRTDYNALVVANTAGADMVLDLTANPVMGSVAASQDTTLYPDNLHPSSLGYAYLAGAPSGTYANPHTYYDALRSVLRSTSLGAGYVP